MKILPKPWTKDDPRPTLHGTRGERAISTLAGRAGRDTQDDRRRGMSRPRAEHRRP